MKKIVSILLAVMMIAAIAVPSFAVDPITITELITPLILSLSSVLSSRFRLLLKMKEK